MNFDVSSKWLERLVGNREVARDMSPVSIVTVPTVRKSVGCVLTTSPHIFSDWYVDRGDEATAENVRLEQRNQGNDTLLHCETDA